MKFFAITKEIHVKPKSEIIELFKEQYKSGTEWERNKIIIR